MRKIFLSRVTVIVLIGSALCAVFIGAVVPQAFITPAAELNKWRFSHGYFLRWVDVLGLHHIFTTPGFALLLSLSCISLGIAAFEQCRASWRRVRQPFSSIDEEKSFFVPLDCDEAARKLPKLGYFRTVHGGMRFVRHPWGYFGNSLLHLGMLVTLASSLCIALTQTQGVLDLMEGEIRQPGQPWGHAEKGLLGQVPDFPEAVRLNNVRYTYGPDGGVRSLASNLAFLAADGSSETRTAAVNSVLHRHGFRIYQGLEFGHAFYVELTDPAGRKSVLELPVKHQLSPEKPGYGDFPGLPADDCVLRTKYFADEAKKSLENEDPLLILRVDRQGRELGQLPLKTGESGSIENFQFRLLNVSRWSRLIFVSLVGIPGVFFGFFITALGGILHYFTPPREIVIQETAQGCRMGWRAARFAGFYDDEFKHLQEKFGAKKWIIP